MFASTKKNTGILVAGISTLIAGLLSLTAAVIVVVRISKLFFSSIYKCRKSYKMGDELQCKAALPNLTDFVLLSTCV